MFSSMVKSGRAAAQGTTTFNLTTSEFDFNL